MEPLNWNCDICGEERNDDDISVYSPDRSSQFNMPQGSVRENIKYCNDKPECWNGANTFTRFIK